MPITGSQKALMYCQSGVERCGASRSNYHSPKIFVAIAGVQYATARAVAAQEVLHDSLTITENDGETPNTCQFQVRGFTPSDGQVVVITFGSINNLDRLFAGTILTDAHSFLGTPANGLDTVNVIDYTWQLTRDTFSQRWTNTSGTVIAKAIIAWVASRGFTSVSVAAGLATLDEFTVTNTTPAAALTALCGRLGATWKATYRTDVQLGLTADVSQTDPVTLTAASALVTFMTAFKVTRDLGQVITRQAVEGGGGTAIAACGVGETQIPVSDLGWYNASGGTVVCGPQRITYTGKTQAAPTTAPTITPSTGAGIDDGGHQWAYTFVTASGETLASALSLLQTMETVPVSPAIASITSAAGVGGPAVGVTVTYGVAVIKNMAAFASTGLASGASDLVTATPFVAAGSTLYTVNLTATAAHVGRTIGLFRADTGGGGNTSYSLISYAVVAAAGAIAIGPDSGLYNTTNNFFGFYGAPAGWTGSNVVNQAAIAGVAVGPTGTTQRKVYRTAAGGSQLKLQQTIANNTATTGVTDSTADASLGANAPTSDTSALVLTAVSTTSGATAAGSTTMTLVSAAAFLGTPGGWAIAAGIPIRYAGKSGNQLTGIPTTGAGSISAAIPAASTVTTCNALTGIPASGVGSILYAIHQGDQVNLRVVIDDLAAQAAITTLMLPTVDDGVIEGTVIQDGRISETEARARGTAQLALRSAIDQAVTYTTRDKNTHAGRTVAVNLPAPTSVVGSFKLKTVTINNFQPAQWPTFQASAASKQFTLEMLLRLSRLGK